MGGSIAVSLALGELIAVNAESSYLNPDAIIKMAAPYVDDNFPHVLMAAPSVDDNIEVAAPPVDDNHKEILSPPCTKDPSKCRFFFLLRNMRVEFQTIRTSFSDLIDLNSSSEKETSSVETSEIHKNIYSTCSGIITKNLEIIDTLFEENPCISEHGDTVQAIKDKWYLINSIFGNYAKDNKKNVDILKKCVQYLEDEIYLCNIITVPDRVAANLKTLKSGYSLDFYEEFKDEFCSKEQSNEMLKYLARHPAFIDDIIDESQGLILKVEPKKERWKGYLRIVGTFLLGIGVISWFFNSFTGEKYTFSDINLYFVFFSGALFHIAIDAIKSTKSSTGIQFKSVDDWSRWINIKELSIIFGIFLLDLTFIGLVVTVDLNELDRLTLVAAGYSFDSIGEIFSNRFENILGKKATALKAKISST